MNTVSQRIDKNGVAIGYAVDGDFDQTTVTKVLPDILQYCPVENSGVRRHGPGKVYVWEGETKRAFKVAKFEVKGVSNRREIIRTFHLGEEVECLEET